MPYVIDTKQKTRNHRKDNRHHQSFHIDRIPDLRTLHASRCLRNKSKSIERFKYIIVALPLSSFFEVVFYFVQCISQKLHINQLFIIKSIPSRRISCTSCFETSTNSHNARSSSITS